MKNISILLVLGLLLCINSKLSAQQSTINGVLADSLGEPLINGTVVLLHPQDSVMEYFAISDLKGNFKMNGISKGNYILQASYVGYQSYYSGVRVDGKDRSLGVIVLQPEALYLDGATVTADRIPIQIKNDTIEYDAVSFRTQPNDVVEDLLKKLPGVEVEKDGTIRAQGQEVQGITVDGKDFFGTDPKIASQNLPADAIDKVQVFDKKSDVAEFTGVDDGQRNKSINLKLKDDKKKGVFGNVTGGYGTDDRYQGKATVNRFNKKSQLSFLGRANNINEQGFSFEDYINFSGGLQNMMAGGGGMELRFDSNDGPLPFDFGQPNYGFTNTLSGGLNFNYDFSKNTELQSSYFGSKIKKEEDRETFRQNFLDDDTFPSETISEQDSENTNHRLNINLKQKIDSTQVLRFRVNMNMNDRMFNQFTDSKIYNVESLLENDGFSNDQSTGEDFSFASTLSYMLRLKKKGRSFTAMAGVGGDYSKNDNTIESINQFKLTNAQATYSDSLFQEQFQEDDQLDYQLRLSFTEPLGKGRFLQASYNRRNFSNELYRNVYDVNNGQRNFNDFLSDEYIRDYYYDKVGLTYRRNRKKTNFSAGVQWQSSALNGQITSDEREINRPFEAWLPSMSWQYDFSTSKNLRVNYTTNFREPRMDQLQPLVNNSNPLSLYVGNPELQPEYIHRLNIALLWFDQFSFTNFFASINGRYTKDRITNASTIDEQFRQITQPVNVERDIGVEGNLSYGMPLKFMKSKFNIDLNAYRGQGILFINDIENNTERWNNSIDFSLENRKKEVVDILGGIQYARNTTVFSESSEFNQIFSSFNYYGDLNINLKDWEFGTSIDYTIYKGDAFNDQDPVPMWRASISKYFLKANRGQLTLSAVDILNQGIGINRNSTFNYIEDTRINSLGRYFMLSFTYKLSAFGDQGSGGIQFTTRRR